MKHEKLQGGSLAVSDTGSIDLLANEYGVIDTYGGICIHGTFTDSLPEFVNRGTILLDHDEEIFQQIAMPQSVTEKQDGLHIQADFHSTEDAQKARTIIAERLLNKKHVGVSVGLLAEEILFIGPSEYDKVLPKYIRPEKYKEERKKADGFDFLFVRLKAKLNEASIVTRPANVNSGVKQVLSEESKTGITLNEQLKAVIGQLDELHSRAESIALRNAETLEGKVFSRINLTDLKECHEKLGRLISKAEPVGEKEEPLSDNRTERIKALEIYQRLN